MCPHTNRHGVTSMNKNILHPLIGIPADVREIGIHPFHAVGEKYINAVAHGSRAVPLLIPALGPGRDLESMLDHVDLEMLVARLDGLFLTGSPSNVEPLHYDGDPSAPDTHHDPQRDATTLELIRTALAEGLPVFGVCRGYQEINVALGGTLYQEVHEVPDKLDHRDDKSLSREDQYAPAHPVRLAEGSFLASLAGSAEVVVNSLHAQGVDRLAAGLEIEATAPDGLVEAFRVESATTFAMGVQWHPEWRYQDDPLSRALFAAFGDAARERAAQRRQFDQALLTA